MDNTDKQNYSLTYRSMSIINSHLKKNKQSNNIINNKLNVLLLSGFYFN